MIPHTEKCAFVKLVMTIIQGNRNAYVITILVTHITINDAAGKRQSFRKLDTEIPKCRISTFLLL